jgi:hypothetical protein
MTGCPSKTFEPVRARNVKTAHREPWNNGKIVGQKAAFKIKDIWVLRARFQIQNRVRELALFNLGIDSKLRGCDLVSLEGSGRKQSQ